MTQEQQRQILEKLSLAKDEAMGALDLLEEAGRIPFANKAGAICGKLEALEVQIGAARTTKD